MFGMVWGIEVQSRSLEKVLLGKTVTELSLKRWIR